MRAQRHEFEFKVVTGFVLILKTKTRTRIVEQLGHATESNSVASKILVIQQKLRRNKNHHNSEALALCVVLAFACFPN